MLQQGIGNASGAKRNASAGEEQGRQPGVPFCSACDPGKQVLDFQVEFPRNFKRRQITIRRQIAGHAIVRKMNTVLALVDEDGDRRIGRGLRHALRCLPRSSLIQQAGVYQTIL